MSLIITTSREPSRRTRSFVKDLITTIPNTVRVNRGKSTLSDLRNVMISHRARGVLIIYERRGNPSALTYFTDVNGKLTRVLLLKITSIKLSREISGYQKPVNVSRLVINEDEVPNGLPSEVANAFVTIFNTQLVSGGVKYYDAVEVKLVGESNHVKVSFICVGSGRVCGPQLGVSKVVKYAP